MPNFINAATVSLVGAIILAVLVLFGALLGALRGVKRTGLRVLFIVLSAIISIIAAGSALKTALPIATDALAANGTAADIISILEMPDSAIYKFVNALAAPLVFFAVFVALNIVLYLLYLIFGYLVLGKIVKARGGAQRLTGALLGALCGVLLFSLVSLPVFGYISVVNDALEASPALAEKAGELKDEGAAVEASFVSVPYEFLGGKAVFDALSSYDGHGVSEDLTSFLSIYTDASPLLEKPLEEWGSEEAAAIRSVGDTLNENETALNMVYPIVNTAAGRWAEGESFAGIAAPKAEGETAELVSSFVNTLSNCEFSSFKGGVSTLTEQLAVIAENGVINDIKDIDTLFSKDTAVLSSVLCALMEDDLFKPVIPAASNMGVELLAKNLEIEEDKIPSMLASSDALVSASDARLENEKKNVTEFLSSVSSLYGEGFENIDDEKLLSVAKLLDITKSSLLFSDASDEIAEKLLSVCVESGVVTESAKETILSKYAGAQIKEDGTLSFSMEKTVDSALEIKNMVSLLGKKDDDAPETPDDPGTDTPAPTEPKPTVSETIGKLASTVTEDSAEVINEMITEDLVSGYIPEQSVTAVTETVKSVVTELGRADELDDEAKEKEAAAIENMYGVLSSTSETEYSKDDAKNLVSSVLEADIVKSAIVSGTKDEESSADLKGVASSVDASVKAEIVGAVVEAPVEEEEKESLEAIASLVDASLTFDSNNNVTHVDIGGTTIDVSGGVDINALIAAFGGIPQ